MKIILVGFGGREHALAWSLKNAPSRPRVLCPNGNAGIAMDVEAPRWEVADWPAWDARIAEERPDLVVIGPEAPLVAGLADMLRARGIAVFGPGADGAAIEGSKAFAKELMRAAEIPTGQSESFTNADEALDYARGLGLPVVIKADGLAAGKGVTVAATAEERDRAILENLRDHRFGEASTRIIVEEFLEGEEVSLLALCDGRTIHPLIPAEDYKRVGDGDTGPNTGGMGAVAPTPVMNEELLANTHREVFLPLLEELQRRGINYRGVIYAGLMLTRDGVRVLEFNARFGDPETQVLLPLFDGDLATTLLACAEGKLGALVAPRRPSAGPHNGVIFRPECAMAVVLASRGYPETPEVGKRITGLEELALEPNCKVFHAATRRGPDGTILTVGGRVLNLTVWGPTVAACRDRAERLVSRVAFDGMIFRRDIGSRAMRHEK